MNGGDEALKGFVGEEVRGEIDVGIISWDWLDFFFGGGRCVLRGCKREGCAGRIGRKCNRLWGCVWAGKIDETEAERTTNPLRKTACHLFYGCRNKICRVCWWGTMRSLPFLRFPRITCEV